MYYRLKSLSLATLVLSLLMTEFYQQWQQNPNKAVALRNAMLKTMKKHPSPVDWAAFTLIAESKRGKIYLSLGEWNRASGTLRERGYTSSRPPLWTNTKSKVLLTCVAAIYNRQSTNFAFLI